MATDLRSELANIKDFEQLVVFLRDQMGWPIGNDDSFEELTFEYKPEELGIDEKNAAKIQEIKRLRPLTSNQPWGIFFVKFEPKALPVVALRRILSQVTLKKRSSANPSERKSWSENDLLFISNYGETVERKISLAHFSKPQNSRDLPTLKVLGWDNLDTPLHLDSVARELTQNLSWPEKEDDIEQWRLSWTGAFKLLHRETITTAKELSVHLAELARTIRDRINTALVIETERGPLTNLLNAFQKSLIHDLSPQGFADMYAQTITYGMLSARIENPKKKTVEDFGNSLRTNPFLRELMETFVKIGGRGGKDGGPGIDFDELGVSEVVELLDNSNMEEVLRDFGDRNPQEDPVIHFYEHFLAAYDKKQKVSRGVFYTPRPVVSFIVRSVDEMLCKEFGLEDGLADTTTWGEMAKKHEDFNIPEGVSPDQDFIQILDPATGTGTFLVEAIDLIHKRLIKKWKADNLTEQQIKDLWNDYVPKHLLTRLHGYELLMAPYAIAHLKIGIKLFETGYAFGSNARARIYLTNALEPAQDFSENLEFAIPALAHEAFSVNNIKKNQLFTLILGNPPYKGHSFNKGEWISGLVKSYYSVNGVPLNEKNPKWLQDDYVKFIRLAQFSLQESQIGVCGYITNHSYSDNSTFRGMRHSLMKDFCNIKIIDLHGNSKKIEQSPDGSKDENVFDIKQGVSILLASRFGKNRTREGVFHTHLWGERKKKNNTLSNSVASDIKFERLYPNDPFYLFIPQNTEQRQEYDSFFSIVEMFQFNNMGITTGNDKLYVSFSATDLEEHLRDPFFIRNYSYRLFDKRYIYYKPEALARSRFEFMKYMIIPNNFALVSIRRPRNERVSNFFVSRGLIDKCLLSPLDNCQVFPLYISTKRKDLEFSKEPIPNFSVKFIKHIANLYGLEKSDWSELPAYFSPVNIFSCAYGIFHSQAYRSRYDEFLKIDFPRLPLPRTLELFCELACLGGTLISLHLMESPKLDSFTTKYFGPNNPEVEGVGWSDGTVWLNVPARKKGQPTLPGTKGFRDVSEDVWNFYIGGYKVCEKWLKDRKGRKLSEEDIIHYQKIVVALSETIRIMKEIDTVIEKHGGWPGAFAITP